MRPVLLVLPFIAILVAALGAVVGSSIPNAEWARNAGLGLAAAIVAAWVYLDFATFRDLFSRRGAKYGASSGLVVLLGLAVIIGVGVLAERPRFNKSWDLSKAKVNTLSEESLKVIEKLKTTGKKVQATAFMQDQVVEENLRHLIGLFQAAGAPLEIEYIDPNRDPTRAMSEKLASANTLVLKVGERDSRVTVFTEEKITNGLVNILKDASKTVYFLKGHGEGELRGTEGNGTGTAVEALEKYRYTVKDISLLETGKVPEDADLVVISGPQYDLTAQETSTLEGYLKNGGAMLVMVSAMTKLPNLAKFTESFGIKVNSDFVALRPDDPRSMLLGQNNAIVSEFDEASPLSRDFAKKSAVFLQLPNTRTLEAAAENPNAMKVELVAKTSDAMMRVKGVDAKEDLKGLTEERVDTGAFGVVAVATGKPATAQSETAKHKENRLVVVGSSELVSNAGAATGQNLDMFVNTTNYLLEDEDFISIRPKDAGKSSLNLTSPSSQLAKNLLLVYPFMFLGSGMLYWMRRRRA